MADYPPHHQSSSGGIHYQPPSPASSTDDSSNSNPPRNSKELAASAASAAASSRPAGQHHYPHNGHQSNQHFQEQSPLVPASGFGSSAYAAHASYSSVYPSGVSTSIQRLYSPPPESDSPAYARHQPQAGPRSWPYDQPQPPNQQSSSSLTPRSPTGRPRSPKEIARPGWARTRSPPTDDQVDQLVDEPPHQPQHPQQVRLESPPESLEEEESGPVTLTATAPYRPRPGYTIAPALGRNPAVRPHPPLSPSSSKTYSFVPLAGSGMTKRPRRGYHEIDRLYHCNYQGCVKSYGTLNHLNAHVTMQSHGSKRTPGEFKEMRKEWRKRKKTTGVPHPQDDDDLSEPTAGPSRLRASTPSQMRIRRRRRATEPALPNIATLEGEGNPDTGYSPMAMGSSSGAVYLGGVPGGVERRLSMDEYHLHSAAGGEGSQSERRGSGGTEMTQDLEHSDEELARHPQRPVGMHSPSMPDLSASASVTLSPLAIAPGSDALPRPVNYWSGHMRNPVPPVIPSASQIPGPGPSVQLQSPPHAHAARRATYAPTPTMAYGPPASLQHPVANQSHPSLAHMSMPYPPPPPVPQRQHSHMQSIPPAQPSLPTPPMRHQHAMGLHHTTTPPQHTPVLAAYQASPPPPPPRLPPDSILFTPVESENPHGRPAYQATTLPEQNVQPYSNPGAYDQERTGRENSRMTPPQAQPQSIPPPPQTGSWDGYRAAPMESYPPQVSRPYDSSLRSYPPSSRAPEQYAPYRQAEPSYDPHSQPVRRPMPTYIPEPYLPQQQQQPPQRTEPYAPATVPSASGPQYAPVPQRSDSNQYEYMRQDYQQPQVGYSSQPIQYPHPHSFPPHHPGHQPQHPNYQNQPQSLPPGHPANSDPYGRGPPGPGDGGY